MISRSISTSVKLSKVSDFAALLFTWIIPHTDDFGRMDGDSATVKGIVVPMRDKTTDEIEEALIELDKSKLIERYEVDGRKFLYVAKFEQHQTFKVDRPRQAQFPVKRGLVSKRKETNQYTDDFENAWLEYPNKVNKFMAFRAYQKIKPDEKLKKIIFAAIATQKSWRQWQEGFIPHFSTWLNGRRWEDIPQKPKTGGEGRWCEDHQHFIPKGMTCGYTGATGKFLMPKA